MPDVLSTEQRSYCMSRIRGKNTKPELLIRSGLFALGLRFRLHDRKLPGSPDLILAKHHAVIFVHGCLWHKHDCHLFQWPRTNARFWRSKICKNHKKDLDNALRLREAGWRVLTVWECALRGRYSFEENKLIERIARWIRSGRGQLQICGRRLLV